MATGTVGDRGHMNYVFTPTECFILNYPQLLILNPSQGFLSSSCRTPAIYLQEGLWRPPQSTHGTAGYPRQPGSSGPLSFFKLLLL